MANKIIGITGHQNIPREAVLFIHKGIEEILSQFKEKVTCVSSLAVGADQLFAIEVLEAGGELNVIIPCADYESTFVNFKDLVDFKNLLKSANTVEQLNYKVPSEDAFLAAGRRVVDLSEILLAIWDGKKAKGKGGTADIVEYANKKKLEVIILWPNGLKR